MAQVIPPLSTATAHEETSVDLTGLDLMDVDSALALWLNQDINNTGWSDFP